MLKRKIYSELLKWKKTKSEECLFIKGARQIGKTFLVREFGKNEYESFIEINFLKYPSMKEIFEDDLSAETILKKISIFIPNSKFIPGNTLIFLDEIQKCARARTALKFLATDNRIDVIASGSLLGLHYDCDADPEVEEVESVPVGYEQQITMYSLDFEEFLWGYGYSEQVIAELKGYFENRQAVPEAINKKFEQIFREYMVVGGMPEVVDTFFKTNNYGEVHKKQNKIIASYADDIANHAKGNEKIKVRACYDSVPRQLARENNKFKYSDVEKKATARKYEDSIEWLKDSNLVHISYNVYEPYLPLTANAKNNEFKVYINDTGLLLAMYGQETKLAVLNGTLKGNAKGGIYENIISETLIKSGYKLYYYKTQNSSMEIEFVIEKDGGVCPVEVKAGNTSTASLNSFSEKFSPAVSYKIAEANIGVSGNKFTLPHYMAMFI